MKLRIEGAGVPLRWVVVLLVVAVVGAYLLGVHDGLKLR